MESDTNSSQNKDQQYAQFQDLTGTDLETAKRFLEIYPDSIDMAVAAFFDSLNEDEEEESAQLGLQANNMNYEVKDDDNDVIKQSGSSRSAAPHSTGALSSNIHTLGGSGLRLRDKKQDDSSAQEFYVGGAERGGSGQQVLGSNPGRGGRGGAANRIATLGGLRTHGAGKRESGEQDEEEDGNWRGIFDDARKHGAVEVTDQYHQRQQQQQRGGRREGGARSFQGAGHQLGAVDSPSTNTPSGTAAAVHPPPSVAAAAASVFVSSGEAEAITIKIYANGFTITEPPPLSSASTSASARRPIEGALRSGESAQDRQFIGELHRGKVPAELVARHGLHVPVNVMDCSSDDWKPPPFSAFQGEGHTLGSPNQDALGGGAFSSSQQPITTEQIASTSSSSANSNADNGSFDLQVDESQPITMIRFRLATGQLHGPIRFNSQRHTLADLHRYVIGQMPVNQRSRNFALMTSYPNTRTLENTADKILQEEGLANETLMQKWC